ncbi:tryptophan--tRNA ligase [Candidatus Woesearchaeota archaeon]|nr:tryptophan--tRNA ligase [Candidatus Woesearchaeota archaeon]
MPESSFTVTPWSVKGDVDYDKLITQFGVKKIDDALLKRIKKLAGGEIHPYLRRGIFFSHMYLDKVLDAVEKKEKAYLYTGRAPSGPVHLGHLVPWMFTKWLQDKFNMPLLFQIPDEEKVLFKDNLTAQEAERWTMENIYDIIAVGFDPKKTKIFIDTEYAGHMYKHACSVAKKTTASTAKALFGLTDSDNVGKYFYTCMQSVPAFLPTVMEGKKTPCLIPCAIDQDVHFRLTRDVAEGIGFPKPATILCRFLPALAAGGKMSASEMDTLVAATDSPDVVRKKIMKYAFSGGRDNMEEHRKYGGNPDIDVAYQWLMFFEEDDAKLKKIHDDYKSGKLLSGELKMILVDKLNAFLKKHQAAREKAKKSVEKFMLRD